MHVDVLCVKPSMEEVLKPFTRVKPEISDWNLTPVNRSNRPAFQFVVKALCDGFFIVKYYLLIFTKLISIGCKEVYM